MTLAMRCSSCRVVVSNDLAACPHCGKRLARPSSQRTLAAPPGLADDVRESTWEHDLETMLGTPEASEVPEPTPVPRRPTERHKVIESAQADARRILERA